MAGAYAVVKGTKLRLTRINSCGLPIAGPANRLVTDGWVSAAFTPVMRDAEELEQVNAEGRVCVADRTPPERKWWTVDIEFCKVDPDAFTLLTSWEKVLDYAGESVGYRDQKEVEGDFGVAIEIWSPGKSEDDCPIPTLDSAFTATGSGKSYTYFLLGATEFTLGDYTIEAAVATFRFSGITVNMSNWGKGPYNVQETDALGTPGRLLAPTSKKEHITKFRTMVAPPNVTDGAVVLDILGKFADPDFYFGGPGNAPPADIAPEQDEEAASGGLTITGGPTGGTFTLNVHYAGDPDIETATIAYNANAAAVLAALAGNDDGYVAGDWSVTGTALPTGPVSIIPPAGVSLEPGDNNLTGGTSPTVVFTPA